jgi:hypothetical protein
MIRMIILMLAAIAALIAFAPKSSHGSSQGFEAPVSLIR